MIQHEQILIAGASGWIGQKVAKALQSRGVSPRLMMRGGAKHPKAAELSSLVAAGAEIVDADVTKESSLSRAMAGIEIIISTVQGGSEVIIEGQLALAAAGKAAGARRIFPSDFCVDHRALSDDEHLLLGWRRHADAAIREIGLPQTNTLNGAFTDLLMADLRDDPFFGLVGWESQVVAFWGDADQPYDFTSTDDAAEYVAAAALDRNAPNGGFQIAGDVASPRRLSAIIGALEGRPFALRQLGTLDDLDFEIARRQAAEPHNPIAWGGLQFHRAMASGRGKLRKLDNGRYPEIVPTSIERFLRASRAASVV
ncbi:MAG: NmrA family NAD(P)-binding protein [Gemmatimonadota bacterium]